jgi:hypothetical protein
MPRQNNLFRQCRLCRIYATNSVIMEQCARRPKGLRMQPGVGPRWRYDWTFRRRVTMEARP